MGRGGELVLVWCIVFLICVLFVWASLVCVLGVMVAGSVLSGRLVLSMLVMVVRVVVSGCRMGLVAFCRFGGVGMVGCHVGP